LGDKHEEGNKKLRLTTAKEKILSVFVIPRRGRGVLFGLFFSRPREGGRGERRRAEGKGLQRKKEGSMTLFWGGENLRNKLITTPLKVTLSSSWANSVGGEKQDRRDYFPRRGKERAKEDADSRINRSETLI